MTCTIIILGIATWNRNKVWSSGTAFWGNIIANAPTKARAYNNYGVALADQGKFKDAIPYFQKAIQLDQCYADPHNNLAVAFRSTGKLDEGIKALQRSVRLQPNYPEAYNNLASFLMEKKDFNQAEKALELALRLRPTYGKAMYNKAKVYHAQAQFDKAFECYKKACLEADFDNPTGFNHYAMISMQLRKYEDAALAYQKLLEYEPHSFDHSLHLADAFYLNHNYDKAYQLYKKIEPRNPNDNRILHNIAETLWKMGHPDEAIPYFERAVAQQNCNPQTIFQYAACCELLGNSEKAKTIISNAMTQPALPNEWQQKMKLAMNHLEKKTMIKPHLTAAKAA
jgi:tetratricopeptide (TPR) repeat protein